ncbi:MAG: glutamate formimidoyltransferase [Vicinamibacteria bacterium]|nr:glutamate formimidoyltransferase [Vicinamibacteria bacterium]
MRVIEAVPNVSEGRRGEVLEEARRALLSVEGLHLLDVHSDPDHNRAVLTLVATRDDVLLSGLLRLIEVAVTRIDLRRHAGVHPRVGAVDVVPFVPLGTATMAECVALAETFGRETAARFDLPVYLYGHAARAPHRFRHDVIRRGGFEKLARKMEDSLWAPDFGPLRPHPTAGAVVAGARSPLVAYNVNLASIDLAAAGAIAREIRESDGGLPCVRAMGVFLAARGLAQVSTNLVDYTRTPPLAVFERVREEAARRGIEILESEIVGLVPQAALPGNPSAVLRLPHFSSAQVLECRIQEALGLRRFP